MNNKNRTESIKKFLIHRIYYWFFLTVFASISMAQTTNQIVAVDAVYPTVIENTKKLSLTGTVEAQYYSQIGPLEAGSIETIMFEIGDKVKIGQPLLTLNSQLAELEINRASSEVNIARINVTESERLYQEALRLSEQKVVAKTLKAERAANVSSAKAQLQKALTTLELWKEKLRRHTLKSPIEGVITERNANIGEWVTQQSNVLTLVSQNDLRLTVAIPQHYFPQLNDGFDVAVIVKPDSLPHVSLSTKVSRIVPVSNEKTRTFLAQIDLPKETDLAPGMSAKAELSLPNSQQSKIILPRSAIKQHPDGGSSVFVAVNNKAKRILTNYSSVSNNSVAIYNQPTDQAYIISGVELLQDGMPLTVNVLNSLTVKDASND